MANWFSKFKKIQEDALALWDESIFRTRGEPSRLYKFIHFWVLVGRSFVRNRCPIRASALSYTSLLAMIPMLAVAISVTSSLLKKEGEEQIYHFIDKLVSGIVPPATIETNAPAHAEEFSTNTAAAASATNEVLSGLARFPSPASTAVRTNPAAAAIGATNEPALAENDTRATAQREAARRIHQFISNTQSKALAGVGMLALVYVAIQMLSQIEGTFNDIWGVTRGRNWITRIVLYWTTITLGPLLLVGALGLASGPHFQSTQELIRRMPFIGNLVFRLLTLIVIWLTFTLLYQLVPNTRVRFSAAMVGGLIGGSLWHLNNVFGFIYVSRVVTNSKIYGSLALVPVFMVGLYFSWIILLFGAQVAYAFQNRTLYLQDKIAENVNQRGREFIALRLMTCIGQRFHRGLAPATLHQMSVELGIPTRLVQQILQTLLAARLVSELAGAEAAYTPARPLDSITAHHLLMAMRALQGQELVTRDEPVREEVYGEFARIQEAERQVASSVTVLALVNRAEARLQDAPHPPHGSEMKLSPALSGSHEPASDAASTQPNNPEGKD